jgi:hypothetical protein
MFRIIPDRIIGIAETVRKMHDVTILGPPPTGIIFRFSTT